MKFMVGWNAYPVVHSDRGNVAMQPTREVKLCTR